MDLAFRPTVDGNTEPSLEEMVFAYFYNNTQQLHQFAVDEASRLTKLYFESLSNGKPD